MRLLLGGPPEDTINEIIRTANDIQTYLLARFHHATITVLCMGYLGMFEIQLALRVNDQPVILDTRRHTNSSRLELKLDRMITPAKHHESLTRLGHQVSPEYWNLAIVYRIKRLNDTWSRSWYMHRPVVFPIHGPMRWNPIVNSKRNHPTGERSHPEGERSNSKGERSNSKGELSHPEGRQVMKWSVGTVLYSQNSVCDIKVKKRNERRFDEDGWLLSPPPVHKRPFPMWPKMHITHLTMTRLPNPYRLSDWTDHLSYF